MIEIRAIGALLLLAAQPLSAQQVPGQDEYAYGFPILLQPGSQSSGFHSVELPLALYQSVTDVQLRDLGVYDGANQPVPRVLRPRQKTVERDETITELRVFALPASEAATAENIRILLRQADGATNVELTTGVGDPSHSNHYVIDTQALDKPLQALDLEWADVPTTFVAAISIEGSNDLDRWTTVGAGAIAHLQNSEGNLLQQRINLNGNAFDYLRVTVSDMPKGWQLTSARGVQVSQSSVVERRWETLQASDKDKDGGLIFDLGGSVPIDRVQIKLSGDNNVVRGVLYYGSGDRWVKWREGVFYRLNRNGTAVTNEPLAIAEHRSQRFKFKIKTGRSNVPVQLVVGWRPESLIFLAQGEGPYTLAAGRAAEQVAGFPHTKLYGDRAIFDLALDENIATLAQASLGPRVVLGGVELLTIAEQRDWRRFALWASLVLALLVVGWIAVSLLRQLNSSDP
jgi:hypothetical protein